MKKTFILAFCFLLAALASLDAQVLSKEMVLYVGETKVVSVDMPYRVAIGKPEILDVKSASDTEIVIEAKSPGASTFVFWDLYGEHNFNVSVLKEDMSTFKERIDQALQRIKIPGIYSKAVDSEGKVMLLGEVSSSGDRERIFTALGSLKEKVVDLIQVKEEEAMVAIDVQVLELNKDATSTLGFEWPGAMTVTERLSPGIDVIGGAKWSNLFAVLNLSRTAFSATLNLLVNEGKARILSRPSLVCQSGKEAELLVGGEKPILTTQIAAIGGGTGGSTTEVEYKEYGIKLNIKPTVVEGERIRLALKVEVSEPGDAEILGTSNEPTAKAYPLTKRNASTELLLDDGQTISIGGLIKQKKEEDIRKTPFFGDIPLIGMLFRKKTTELGGGTGELGDTELFITLTAKIMERAKKDKFVNFGEQDIRSQEMLSMLEPNLVKSQRIRPQLHSYIRAIQSQISQAIDYPREARDAGWHGIVKLSIELASDGSLENISVLQSSGYKILDDAGEDAVRRASPFPPIPAQLNLSSLRIEMPVIYHKD